jgi:hypothetical protein
VRCCCLFFHCVTPRGKQERPECYQRLQTNWGAVQGVCGELAGRGRRAGSAARPTAGWPAAAGGAPAAVQDMRVRRTDSGVARRWLRAAQRIERCGRQQDRQQTTGSRGGTYRRSGGLGLVCAATNQSETEIPDAQKGDEGVWMLLPMKKKQGVRTHIAQCSTLLRSFLIVCVMQPQFGQCTTDVRRVVYIQKTALDNRLWQQRAQGSCLYKPAREHEPKVVAARWVVVRGRRDRAALVPGDI